MIFEFYKKEIFPIVLTNVYMYSCALGIFAIIFGIPFFSSQSPHNKLIGGVVGEKKKCQE